MLEHRYYGLSNPFDDLSDSSLRFHTIQQAVDDLEYAAADRREDGGGLADVGVVEGDGRGKLHVRGTVPEGEGQPGEG